uniref:Uncharacterized protein MANES_02G108200 n=1 Tax=Rhizophora mucronata TaxID=61149 RepID=A0A2P2KK61_RHIMU
MATWEHLGEVANVVQLTGLDAVKLIGLIVKASHTARMHKKNCVQFARHLRLIGNLLEQLKISELKRYPETREPLEQLEDSLRRAYVLVQSCREKSYLYLLAMGWNIVYQFRKAQNEIDRYLRLVPLITLVDNARVRERLENIEMDQHEYTLDEEDREVQDVILMPEPSKDSTMVLKKTLSCSYPNLDFKEALKKENAKLQLELQRSEANYDVDRCKVIQHLIEVTEAVSTSSLPQVSSPKKGSKKLEPNYSDGREKDDSPDEGYHKKKVSRTTSRNTSSVSSGHDLLSSRDSHLHDDWHTDLLGCCSEPYLCMSSQALKLYFDIQGLFLTVTRRYAPSCFLLHISCFARITNHVFVFFLYDMRNCCLSCLLDLKFFAYCGDISGVSSFSTYK